MFSIITRGYHFSFKAIQTVQSSQTFQHVIDFVNFALGFVGVHNLIQTHYFKDREVEELYEDLPLWQQTAWKTADLLGSLSLILGGMTSQPALIIWKWSVQKILSPANLERFLSPQGYLPANKMYKTVGLVAFLIGIPATLKTLYGVYCWMLASSSSQLFAEQDEHFYKPLPLYSSPQKMQDLAVTLKTVSQTAKTVSQTAQKIISLTPHK